MIDELEDHYRWDSIRWDSIHQVFVLLEDDPGLVDIRAQRVDVQAARVAAGWVLMTTAQTEANAQPSVIDVWIRTNRT